MNIALVFISLIIAIVLPFKLFLFSYAILGPLHYLTEIGWLHKKKYFVRGKQNWVLILLLISVLASLYPMLRVVDYGGIELLKNLTLYMGSRMDALVVTALIFTVGLVSFRNTGHLIVTAILTFAITSYLSLFLPTPFMLIGLFVPTLIHVYVFTFLFTLYGALQVKSRYGILVGICMLTVPFIIYFLPNGFLAANFSEEIKEVFIGSNMVGVSAMVARIVGGVPIDSFDISSQIGVRIQTFIAFAYTYHYLNWFSKTTVIGWQKALSKKEIFAILTLWILLSGIYIYDFQTGFVALFFLSYLHVFLELPLNAISVKGILLLRANEKQR